MWGWDACVARVPVPLAHILRQHDPTPWATIKAHTAPRLPPSPLQIYSLHSIARTHLLLQPHFHILRQKSGLNSIQVALEEVALAPAERLVQLLVFLGQRDVCDHARIAIHAQRDAGFVERIDGMVRVALKEIDLHIRGRAYFEVDTFFAQVFDQSRVLDAAHTVSNP